MKFKQLILSAIMLAASAGAQAAVYDIGALPEGYSGFGPYTVNGSFLDKINFSLVDQGSGGFVADALNITLAGTPIFNISGLSMSLFDNNNNVLASGLDFTVSSMSGGNYYLQVTGTGSGLNDGGIYAGGIQVTAVPETDVWSMLVAGLTMIGFMAFRQRDMR